MDGDETVYERITDLLGAAASCLDDQKAELIQEAQAAILSDQKALLDGFLDEMLALLSDRVAAVRQVTIQFLEDACRSDHLVIPKVIEALVTMFDDETEQSVLIQLSQSSVGLFECALASLAKLKRDEQSATHAETWEQVIALRNKLVTSLTRPDCLIGVRLRTISALECFTSALLVEFGSTNSKSRDKKPDFSEKKYDIETYFLRRETRETEGRYTIDCLVNAMRATAATNNMPCASLLASVMRTCINIATLWPSFAQRIVDVMSLLRDPEVTSRLSTMQRNAIRKDVRVGWLYFLKQYASTGSAPVPLPYESISTVLFECGMSQSELNKLYPPSAFESAQKASGVSNVEPADVDADADTNAAKSKRAMKRGPPPPPPDNATGTTAAKHSKQQAPDAQTLETIANDLVRKLTPINVTDLVLLSMVCLPDTMPDSLRAAYKPIVQAGSPQQIRALALLLAPQVSQLTLAPTSSVPSTTGLSNAKTTQSLAAGDAQQNAAESTPGSNENGKVNVATRARPPASAPKARSTFSLSNVAKRLDAAQIGRLVERCYASVCALERVTTSSSWLRERNKMLVSLALLDNSAGDGGELMDYLERYIMESLVRVERRELAALWLYAEYAYCQMFDVPLFTASATGAHSVIDLMHPRSMDRYDCVLTRLLLAAMNYRDPQQEGDQSVTTPARPSSPGRRNGLPQKPVQSAPGTASSVSDTLFTLLLLDAPYVTPNAIELLKQFCTRSTRVELGVVTLRRLIAARRSNENLNRDLLRALLALTAHDDAAVQQCAVRTCTDMYTDGLFATEIHQHAVALVRMLSDLASAQAQAQAQTTNDEERMRAHVRLFISLMVSATGELLLELADLYADAHTDAKRFLLRAIEQPVRQLASVAGGAAILKLVDAFDTRKRAADTLLLRVLHVLTERQVPPRELVRRVEALFKRSGNVRLLVPVLHGLAKADLLAALPKLVTLDEKLLKDAITRVLLGTTASGAPLEGAYLSPLNAAEFFVALHNLEFVRTTEVNPLAPAATTGTSSAAVSMTVILRTLNLFLSDARLYTPDVATHTLTQLVEQTPIPTPFMRTVLQTQASQPRLSGLVVSLLTRLVQKAIWKHDDLWKGFVLACQRTFPACASALFQLPLAQLQNVFERAPDLRERLLKYVSSLPPHSMNVPKAVLQALQLIDKPQPQPQPAFIGASNVFASVPVADTQMLVSAGVNIATGNVMGAVFPISMADSSSIPIQPNGSIADLANRALLSADGESELPRDFEAAVTRNAGETVFANLPIRIAPQAIANVVMSIPAESAVITQPQIQAQTQVLLQPQIQIQQQAPVQILAQLQAPVQAQAQLQAPAQSQSLSTAQTQPVRAGLRGNTLNTRAQQRMQLANADKQKLLKMKKIDFLATDPTSAPLPPATAAQPLAAAVTQLSTEITATETVAAVDPNTNKTETVTEATGPPLESS